VTYYFHPGAEAEHLEAIAFFESRQRDLGAAYLKEFESLMTEVIPSPGRYRIESKPDIRRVSLTRFSFKSIFRSVNKGESIQILAVSHKRRRPDYWLPRTG
jgi:hypothetical protein